MKDPQTVEVARQNATNEQVEQLVYSVDAGRKRHLLSHLIKTRDMSQVIVFCKTKLSADQLARDLKRDGLVAKPSMATRHRPRAWKSCPHSRKAACACWWPPMWRRVAWILPNCLSW
jgi:hypothetical protein